MFKCGFEKVTVDQEDIVAAHARPDDRDLTRDVTVGALRRDLYDDARLDGLLAAAVTVTLHDSLGRDTMRKTTM